MNALAIRCRRYLGYTATTNGRTERIADQHRLAVWVLLAILAALAMPASGQTTFQTEVVKHLTTSRDFTLKVADAMPAADYGFKLTPPQMSFAGQMIHLSQGLTYFLDLFGTKAEPGKAQVRVERGRDGVHPPILRRCHHHGGQADTGAIGKNIQERRRNRIGRRPAAGNAGPYDASPRIGRNVFTGEGDHSAGISVLNSCELCAIPTGRARESGAPPL